MYTVIFGTMGAGKTSLLADKYLEGAGNCTVILPAKCLKRHLFEGMNICSRNGKMVKVDLAIDSNYNFNSKHLKHLRCSIACNPERIQVNNLLNVY